MKALKCQEKNNKLIEAAVQRIFYQNFKSKPPSDGSQLDKDVAKIVVVVYKAAALICAVLIPESGLGCIFLSEGIVTEPGPFPTVVLLFLLFLCPNLN